MEGREKGKREREKEREGREEGRRDQRGEEEGGMKVGPCQSYVQYLIDNIHYRHYWITQLPW